MDRRLPGVAKAHVLTKSSAEADTSMQIEYINRSGAKYYLHVGVTKTGKPKYYVALHARGPLADAIPDGFEIYESPKGQVSLRKILPKLIFDEELIVVELELARIARLKGSQVERKLKILTVYVADRKEDIVKELSAVRPWRWQVGRDSISERFWSTKLNFNSPSLISRSDNFRPGVIATWDEPTIGSTSATVAH
jgi:hypothetical protein